MNPDAYTRITDKIIADLELIDHWQDVNARTDSGETPLVTAARAGQADTIKLLAKAGAVIWERRASKSDPLWHAVPGGQNRVWKRFLNWGSVLKVCRTTTVKEKMACSDLSSNVYEPGTACQRYQESLLG